MKYVIVGRSGSGKTELASRLQSKGLRLLKTYTTRKPRSDEDAKKYNFIHESEVENFDDRILETNFFGATYFTRKQDVLTADVMILEPDGFMEILGMFPDIQFCLLYIKAEKSEIADARAIARADDKNAEEAAIQKRRAGEDDRFGPLEAMIEHKSDSHINCTVQTCENDFQPETLDKLAANMTGKLRKNNNFVKILTQLVALGALKTSDKNKLTVELDGIETDVSLDVFTELFVEDDNTFSYIIRAWLTHQIDFKIPGELTPDVLFSQNLNIES